MPKKLCAEYGPGACHCCSMMPKRKKNKIKPYVPTALDTLKAKVTDAEYIENKSISEVE